MKKIIKNVYSAVKTAFDVFVVVPLVLTFKVIIGVIIGFLSALSQATDAWADLIIERYK